MKRDPVAGSVEVLVANGKIAAKGSVRIGLEQKNVDSSVSLRDDNVAQNQVVEDGNAQISLSALRVFGLQASPRGQRIGPLLTYHHALEVQDRGCPYVVARDVSAAGGPFHMPLGFRDFVGQPT